MMAELTKGQDVPLTAITPEQIVDAIVHTADSAGLSAEGVGGPGVGYFLPLNRCLGAVIPGTTERCPVHTRAGVIQTAPARLRRDEKRGAGLYIPFVPPQSRQWDEC